MNDIFLQDATAPATPLVPPATINIQRAQVYIPANTSALFGWLHHAVHSSQKDSSVKNSPQRNCAVVICNPIGYEYTHSHRSLRHLADRLASTGFPTLRFDYHGTGDSPGDDLDADRIRCWQQNIDAAIEFTLRTTGCEQICLLGIRMGATLAALVAGARAVDFLVLWSPCASGRRYIREMQAIAAAAATRTAQNSEIMESAGFLMAKETAAQIKSIDLMQQSYLVKQRVLLIARDDLVEDTALFDYLTAMRIGVDRLVLPGYTDMMAEPQFTVVPSAAIDAIDAWLAQQTNRIGAHDANIPAAMSALSFIYTDEKGQQTSISEQPCRFGSDGRLFGIVSFADTPTSGNAKPVVILLNSGTVHRVGPSRLYVALARRLTAQGHTCLRMDLEGLGDSVLYKSNRENHPYPTTAITDTEQALRYLRDTLGHSHFILLGLCSGAHTALHAGIELAEYHIADVIAINPLTYRWVEGMSLETTQHFQDVEYYKQSIRSAKSWLKLLRGKVDLLYLAGIARLQLKVITRSIIQSLRERFFANAATPLAQDLKKLFARGRRLSLFIAANDPGYALLMAGAKYTATKAIKSGQIQVQFIVDGDHTFSTLGPRNELIERICRYIG